MVKFFIFISLLLLENLILPALIGPKQFFITPIFILSLLVYGGSWRTLVYQILPLVLIAELFVGENFGNLIIPFGLTGIIYVMINKFVNLSQDLEHEKNLLSNLILSIITLAVFSYIYAGLSIFFSNSYDFNTGWYEFKIFLKSSLLSLIGWSILISGLFQYVLKKK